MPQVKPIRGSQLNKTDRINRGLVGYWPSNEGSGNKVFDLSGNGNTGTFNGDITWKAGKFGPAPDLAGDTDYITAGILPGLSEITYLAWIRTDNDSLDQGIIRVKDSFLLLYITDGKLRWYPDVAIAAVDASYSFTNNTWYQGAVTQTGTSYAMYVNGVLIGSGTTSALDLVSATNVIIGAYNTTGTWDFDGQIDIPMVYNRALSSSEIALLYREPFSLFEPSWSWNLYAAIGAPPSVVPTPYYYRAALALPFYLVIVFCLFRSRRNTCDV